MIKTRIYKVTTPTGVRLVESPTKGQAVKHCVDADYTADVVGAAEAFYLRDKGVPLERVAMKDKPAKKSGSAAKASAAPAPSQAAAKAATPATTPSTPTAPAQPQSQGAQSSPQTNTVPSTPENTNTRPNTAPSSVPQAEVKAGSFIPPQPAQAAQPPSGVNPVLAEQQRINPDAAAAAGAPPLPPANQGAAPSHSGPVDWEARERGAGQ